jgi:hypothetical protein
MPTSSKSQTTNGSDSLRDLLLEFHGPEVGQKLYEDALKNRAATVKLSALNCEFDRARGLIAAETEAGRLRLSELQEAMDRAYQFWLNACAALESQRIRNQQLKSQGRELLQSILKEMAGPPPPELIKQWGVPHWHKPHTHKPDPTDRNAT